MEKYSGIAPVVKQSGQSRVVQRRYARPQFVHHSFVEYADESLKHCTWAKAFYRQQRAKSKGHYAAVRAVAFKWIRIIFRCWQAREAYHERRITRGAIFKPCNAAAHRSGSSCNQPEPSPLEVRCGAPRFWKTTEKGGSSRNEKSVKTLDG